MIIYREKNNQGKLDNFQMKGRQKNNKYNYWQKRKLLNLQIEV